MRGQGWGEENHQWKGDAASDKSKRARCRQRYPGLGDCEECGGKAVERHHKDNDPGNNAPENIARLCRRCHMEADGRLEAIAEAGRRNGVLLTKEPTPCRICGRLYKPLRHGRCIRCALYLANHGVERPAVESLWSLNTHCRAGHPYDEANTYIVKTGGRRCRACDAARHQERKQAKEKS